MNALDRDNIAPDSAFERGFMAFRAFRLASHCPYASHTKAFDMWREGYHQAECEWLLTVACY